MHRERDRQTDRQRETETETERQTKRDRDRERRRKELISKSKAVIGWKQKLHMRLFQDPPTSLDAVSLIYATLSWARLIATGEICSRTKDQLNSSHMRISCL